MNSDSSNEIHVLNRLPYQCPIGWIKANSSFDNRDFLQHYKITSLFSYKLYSDTRNIGSLNYKPGAPIKWYKLNWITNQHVSDMKQENSLSLMRKKTSSLQDRGQRKIIIGVAFLSQWGDFPKPWIDKHNQKIVICFSQEVNVLEE
jgi:hypothetical protein